MSLQDYCLRGATWGLVVVFAALTVVVVFQSGMRYRYENLGGILWRVDQVTNQRCRVSSYGLVCSLPNSTSPSTSTSTSTSLSPGGSGRR
jgi:hypothetical protein